jgi:hypothetical protein
LISAMIFGNRHAAPVLLLLIISVALPNPILTVCSSANPADCTTCSSCTGTAINNANGYWYSSNNNPVSNCGGGRGTCVAAVARFSAIPCTDGSGNLNYIASSPSNCNSCYSDAPCTSSLCTSGNLNNCPNCASCVSSGAYWSSFSSSSSAGNCVTSYSSAPCNAYVFSGSACSGSSNSQGYKTCDSYSNYNGASANSSPAAAIAGLVIGLLAWLVNMILIGVVSRRKGLNPCPYIVLASVFGIFAWFCLFFGSGQRSTGTFIVSEGVALKPLDGNTAPNPYAQVSAPNPFGNYPAPNPYAQASAPIPYGNYPAPNPYTQVSASNPYGNYPAPNPYA